MTMPTFADTPMEIAGWLCYLLAVGALVAAIWKTTGEYDRAQRELERRRLDFEREHGPRSP
jgi:hypothetical protein